MTWLEAVAALAMLGAWCALTIAHARLMLEDRRAEMEHWARMGEVAA